MRDTFVRTLTDIAKANTSIELITGDLGFGVLKPYYEAVPNQFTNAGIAEQNMTSVAAGMALEGKTVFTYSIGNFATLRCLEQIRNDCAYCGANVKIVNVGGGMVYGSLGMSHHATEDIAIMRALPGVTVVCPGDLVEAQEATKAIVDYQGTVYLRLGRGGEKRIHQRIDDFKIGKAIRIRESNDSKIAVFSTGSILSEAYDACEALAKDDIPVDEYSFHTVKPIDSEVILNCASKCDLIVTIEEHNIIGGFGSAVAEVLSQAGCNVKLLCIGLNDEYCKKVGDHGYLLSEYGINCEAIVVKIHNMIGC